MDKKLLLTNLGYFYPRLFFCNCDWSTRYIQSPGKQIGLSTPQRLGLLVASDSQVSHLRYLRNYVSFKVAHKGDFGLGFGFGFGF